MSRSLSRVRMAGAGAFFLLLIVGVVIRAMQLTLMQGEDLEQKAGRQQYQMVSLQPERGPILDRNGEQLALTVDAASIFVRPAAFPSSPGAIRSVAHALGLEERVVQAKTKRDAPFVWLERSASRGEQAAIERLAVPGIGAEPGTRRFYPHGDLAGALLGFTGVDGNGLEGLEARFDAELRGEGGAVVVERDARGRRMLIEGISRPLPRRGGRVELTIDAGLQHVAEIELDRSVQEFRAQAGLAIALDPRTGEILAVAQSPRFNPNAPDSKRPERWRNRTVTDFFEPGSTMKAFVAAAALEAGVTRPDERLFCENGHYTIGRQTVRDHEPYGWLSFAEVIQHSSNICTAKIGERLGRERLGAALRDFGFGRLTGVDLPGEVEGMVRPVASWKRIELVTTSFGQGISVTPMQLVRAYGALANGGRLMRPFVVKRVIAGDGRVVLANAPQQEGQPVSKQTAATVTQLLERVVEDGTGTKAQIEGVRVAGKTGTAQKVDPRTRSYSARDRMSSFVGYAPADDPRIVIAVVIDSPRSATYGGTVAAPVFRRLAEHALEAMGVSRPLPQAPPLPALPPALPPHAQHVALALNAPVGGVPDVVGLSMRDAVARIDRAGFRPVIDGWGVAIAQDPPPGADVGVGTGVRLQFGSAIQ